MQSSSRIVSFRIRTDVADRVEQLAQRRGVTQSRLVEELLIDAARAAKLDTVDPNDPNSALEELLEQVKQMIGTRRGGGVLNEDVIFEVFSQVKHSAPLLRLHEAAMVAPANSGQPPELRRQYVHQRISRFIKTFLGMRSLREVTLPRGSDALIRSYTKLR